tara:strand:+ start:1235 stop:1873 length:639 start_codon:yes stop_codon:yes gene_type:complete
MKDYTYALDKFLDKYNSTFIFIDYDYGYAGNTLSRIISASPEFYWKGNPILYPDDVEGFYVVYDDPTAPHFASFTEQHLCCTHTKDDFMYPDSKPSRIRDFITEYKNIISKKVCVNSHNQDTHILFPNNTVIRLCGKEPTFRFFKSRDRYVEPQHNSNVINVDVNDIFSKNYTTFETTYLDLCNKLNITPRINSVRAFLLLWLEKQERYKNL